MKVTVEELVGSTSALRRIGSLPECKYTLAMMLSKVIAEHTAALQPYIEEKNKLDEEFVARDILGQRILLVPDNPDLGFRIDPVRLADYNRIHTEMLRSEVVMHVQRIKSSTFENYGMHLTPLEWYQLKWLIKDDSTPEWVTDDAAE